MVQSSDDNKCGELTHVVLVGESCAGTSLDNLKDSCAHLTGI